MFKRVLSSLAAVFRRIPLWQWVLALFLQQFGNALRMSGYAGNNYFNSGVGSWEYLIINIETHLIWISLGAMVLAATFGVLHRDDAVKCVAMGSRKRFALSCTLSSLVSVVIYILAYVVITVVIGVAFYKIVPINSWGSTFSTEMLPFQAFLFTIVFLTAYLFVLVQLCMSINIGAQLPVGSVVGALLICILFVPIVNLSALLLGNELKQSGASIVGNVVVTRTQDGVLAPAILWGGLAVLSVFAPQAAILRADMLARARESEE